MDMTEKEIQKIEKSQIYDIRLTISESTKEEYTKEDVLELLDTIARAKSQE
jgi:hypothetical protein